MVFPVVMYGCESWTIKKSLVPKNWCFWTVVLETTLESHLACTEIQPVNTEGNQSWKFTGRTDAEAVSPILWPSDAKNWLTGKDPDANKSMTASHRGWREECETRTQTFTCLGIYLTGHILMVRTQLTVLVHCRAISTSLGSRKQTIQVHIQRGGRFGGGKTEYFLSDCFYSHFVFF